MLAKNAPEMQVEAFSNAGHHPYGLILPPRHLSNGEKNSNVRTLWGQLTKRKKSYAKLQQTFLAVGTFPVDLFVLPPDVVTSQVNVLPAQRRQAWQKLVIYVLPLVL